MSEVVESSSHTIPQATGRPSNRGVEPLAVVVVSVSRQGVGPPRLDSPESIVDALDHGASHIFNFEDPVVVVVVILKSRSG